MAIYTYSTIWRSKWTEIEERNLDGRTRGEGIHAICNAYNAKTSPNSPRPFVSCWSWSIHAYHASDTTLYFIYGIFLRTHQNLTSCYLSTDLSLQTQNTALQQILSWFILFSLPPSPSQLQTPSTIAVWLSAAWLSGSDPLPINLVLASVCE